MLQPRDLPADWRAVGPPARDTGMMTTFKTCLGTRVDPGERLAVAGSPTYVDAAGDWLASVVSSFRSPQRIADDTALLSDARAPDCFTRALVGGLHRSPSPGVEWGRPDVVLTPGSAGGPANLVARSTEAVVSLGSIDARLPRDLTSRVVQTVAERVAAL
jgi:hypothetical protein